MAVIQKFRKSFGKSFLQTPLPDLVEIQYNSYKDFLQADVDPQNRENKGLQSVFKSMFPIKDYAGIADLEFVEYTLEKPVYNVKECMLRNLTYSRRLKVKLRLILWDVNEDGKKTLRDIKDQEIFMGEVPLMTERGSFIAAGVERVIVSQMHRAQGVVFATTKEAKIAGNPTTYTARIIPEHGSWIDFEESKGVIYVRIDRRRKVPATVLLRCLPCAEDEKKWAADPRKAVVRGMSDTEILSAFYKSIPLSFNGKVWVGDTSVFEGLDKYRLNYDLLSVKGGKELANKGDRLSAKRFAKLASTAKQFGLAPESLVGEYLFEPITSAGEVVYPSGTEITEEILSDLDKMGVKNISIIAIDNTTISAHMRNTLMADKITNREDALIEIYNVIRPGERPTIEAALSLFLRQGFDAAYYDLSAVGRFKMNKRLKIDSGKRPEDERLLTKSDLLAVLKTLTNIIDHKDTIDDIDNLSNRRVRAVGELLEQTFRTGMLRIERLVRESLSSPNIANMQPQDVINVKPLMSLVAEFLGTSQLSQFMDAYNPLSELEHKRRISALGPGGLNRERAGIDVRDVHPTHYGRLCPIHTPEGANIGLINHLSSYARVNEYGFITTPYYEVKDGKVTNKIVYLTADEEMGHKIAQGNTPTTSDGKLAIDIVTARVDGEFTMVPKSEIDLIDVEPRQVVSIATGLIPFVENDDANRALMGSNMMRQSVPLLRAEAPIVGTGIERQVIHDSRVQVMAEGPGVVEYVDAREIHVRYDRTEEEEFVSFNDNLVVYPIIKFRKTNQNTCINLRPIVEKGERVEKGQCLTEGYSTQNGELSIGRNLKVAFMPWKGYNFEDAIVISERVVREDIMTSIHIDEHILEVRDTKRGLEEFTSDIPNVGEDAIKNLDEHGLIRIGASIKPGDILIGKITPKGESDPSPEEKLLRAIFGDKAGDVKDASLKARPSLYGTVIDKKLFTRTVKDRKTKANEKPIIEGYKTEYEAGCKKIREILIQKLFKLVEGKTSQGVKDYAGNVVISKGSKFTQKLLNEIEDFTNVVTEKWTTDNAKNDLISVLLHNYCKKHKEIEGEYKRKEYALSVGDELPAGIMQLAKVYIAQKRKLKVGDKMAGRHGNKGIVSRIVRDEDMPFLADGSIVDIVLNPLGVPSRMNIGQIYETVLGWAGKELGINFATPIFDGASLDAITEYTRKAGVPDFGKTYLYDGGTGERFDQPATVGVIYMLKLGHLIDDKMHARSIGPYSLITQQPLGGKAQFGGQRFGEMEVWAIEAFGASNVLQEILTVKSDDVYGRARAYEAIVKGEPLPTPGLPESFNVLLHELRGLSLNIDFE